MAVDDSSTVVLLHMDGADTSTTFTDESGKTWTARGNAQIDTAQSEFGGASGLFDGTGDWIDTPDSTDFDLFSSASESETIDFWVKINSATDTSFICHYTDANNFWQIDRLSSNNNIGFRLRVGGADLIGFSGSFFGDSNWHHFALVKVGGSPATYTIYKDGTSIATTTSSSTGNFSGTLRIGGNGGAGFVSLNGWLDEFRISKGVARWTANFTPPTAAYAPVSNAYFPQAVSPYFMF